MHKRTILSGLRAQPSDAGRVGTSPTRRITTASARVDPSVQARPATGIGPDGPTVGGGLLPKLWSSGRSTCRRLSRLWHFANFRDRGGRRGPTGHRARLRRVLDALFGRPYRSFRDLDSRFDRGVLPTRNRRHRGLLAIQRATSLFTSSSDGRANGARDCHDR